MQERAAYIQRGRLGDVLALIQVFAFDRDIYRSESDLQDEFQRRGLNIQLARTWCDAKQFATPTYERRENDSRQSQLGQAQSRL